MLRQLGQRVLEQRQFDLLAGVTGAGRNDLLAEENGAFDQQCARIPNALRSALCASRHAILRRPWSSSRGPCSLADGSVRGFMPLPIPRSCMLPLAAPLGRYAMVRPAGSFLELLNQPRDRFGAHPLRDAPRDRVIGDLDDAPAPPLLPESGPHQITLDAGDRVGDLVVGICSSFVLKMICRVPRVLPLYVRVTLSSAFTAPLFGIPTVEPGGS